MCSYRPNSLELLRPVLLSPNHGTNYISLIDASIVPPSNTPEVTGIAPEDMRLVEDVLPRNLLPKQTVVSTKVREMKTPLPSKQNSRNGIIAADKTQSTALPVQDAFTQCEYTHPLKRHLKSVQIIPVFPHTRLLSNTYSHVMLEGISLVPDSNRKYQKPERCSILRSVDSAKNVRTFSYYEKHYPEGNASSVPVEEYPFNPQGLYAYKRDYVYSITDKMCDQNTYYLFDVPENFGSGAENEEILMLPLDGPRKILQKAAKFGKTGSAKKQPHLLEVRGTGTGTQSGDTHSHG